MWTATVSMQLPRRIRTSKDRAAHGFTSLLREKGRDMLVFAFFLVVSTGFWLLQKLNDTFDADIRVPLEMEGVPHGTVITTPLPREVVVTIQDKGTNLFNYLRSGKGIAPIVLDFSAYDNGSATAKVSVPATDVQRAFQQQVNASVRVLRMRPNQFEFHYNKGVSRRLAVKLAGRISTRQQNYMQGLSFSPDSVTVYAPASILDTLRYAYTESQEITELDRTTTFNVGFPSICGVKVVPETVAMTAHVDYYTEQSVSVPVIGLNFPAGMSLKTFPATVTVKYRVGASSARFIQPGNFVLAATYEEFLANPGSKYRLQLKSIPEGVSNVRIYPQEVDYLLEQTQFEDDKAQTPKGGGL